MVKTDEQIGLRASWACLLLRGYYLRPLQVNCAQHFLSAHT